MKSYAKSRSFKFTGLFWAKGNFYNSAGKSFDRLKNECHAKVCPILVPSSMTKMSPDWHGKKQSSSRALHLVSEICKEMRCSKHYITRNWATRSAYTPVSRDVHSVSIRLGRTPVAVLIPGATVEDFSVEGERKDALFVLYVPSDGSACFRIKKIANSHGDCWLPCISPTAESF